jgi:TetR/AcrR family transcriptional regulator, ethionamide resistance regulator
MPPRRTTNAASRQPILDALERLLARQPLDAISIPDILTEANLASRTSFYRTFASRDEAFMVLATHALDEIAREVETALEDRELRRSPELRPSIDRWITRATRHPGLTRSIVSEWPRIDELKTAYLGFMARLGTTLAAAIQEDRTAGHVANPLPAQQLAALILWSVERAVYATMLGARGFGHAPTTTDVLLRTYLQTIYGI